MMSLVESQYDNIAQKALDEAEFEFDDGKEQTDGRGGSTSTALPVEADMVLAYATVPGEHIMLMPTSIDCLLQDMCHGVTLSMGHGSSRHLLVLYMTCPLLNTSWTY